MQILIPTDIYDQDNNLLRIEFYDLDALFIFQIDWNEVFQQSPEGQQLFREDSYLIAQRKGYEIIV
jgi:hypothetical protein